MNLKEAFRYQNKLQSLLDEAQGILDCDANVTKVANTYLRHKVMPEAEDETVMDVAQTEYAEQITDIARFMLYLLEEKKPPVCRHPQGKGCTGHGYGQRGQPECRAPEHRPHLQADERPAQLRAAALRRGAPATASTPRATRSPTAAM